MAVPAYLLSYGAMVLVWGPVSEHFGRRPVILGSLAAVTVLVGATALAGSAGAFIGMRLATAGALGEPLIGWSGLFLAAAAAGLVLLVAALAVLPATPRSTSPPAPRTVAVGYAALLRQARGRRTYLYVLINALLHSGSYTWFGVYLHQRFDLGEFGIGLILLGPVIGRLADRYDMTQPPLGGIVTNLPGHVGWPWRSTSSPCSPVWAWAWAWAASPSEYCCCRPGSAWP